MRKWDGATSRGGNPKKIMIAGAEESTTRCLEEVQTVPSRHTRYPIYCHAQTRGKCCVDIMTEKGTTSGVIGLKSSTELGRVSKTKSREHLASCNEGTRIKKCKSGRKVTAERNTKLRSRVLILSWRRILGGTDRWGGWGDCLVSGEKKREIITFRDAIKIRKG